MRKCGVDGFSMIETVIALTLMVVLAGAFFVMSAGNRSALRDVSRMERLGDQAAQMAMDGDGEPTGGELRLRFQVEMMGMESCGGEAPLEEGYGGEELPEEGHDGEALTGLGEGGDWEEGCQIEEVLQEYEVQAEEAGSTYSVRYYR